jgi:hypothetical protein
LHYIVIVAGRDIPAYEELTYSYGYKDDVVSGCRRTNCLGTKCAVGGNSNAGRPLSCCVMVTLPSPAFVSIVAMCNYHGQSALLDAPHDRLLWLWQQGCHLLLPICLYCL